MDTHTRTTAGTVRIARTLATVGRRAAVAMFTAARAHAPALAVAALRPAAWLAGIAAVVLIGLALAPPVTVTLGCGNPAPLAATEAAPGADSGCLMFCDTHPDAPAHTSMATALVGDFLHAAA